MLDMLARFAAVVGGAAFPVLLVAALAVILTPAVVEGWPASSRWRLASAALGTGAGVVFAALRELAIIRHRHVVTLPTLLACTAVDLLLLAALALVLARPRRAEEGRARQATQVLSCLAIGLALFRAVPELILQMTAFIEPGEQVVSTTMLLRVLGFLGGWAALAVLGGVYYRAARRAPRRLMVASLIVFAALLTLTHLVQLAQALSSAGLLVMPTPAFRLYALLLNASQGPLLLAAAGVWLVPMAVTFTRALGRAPSQPNPARARAARASRRLSRRWVLASAVGFAALAATRTVAVAKVNEKPTLSEPEPYDLGPETASIPLTTLADGHLHRFAYDASGTEVRWIVILKNGGAYGVGLDACESCGPSGYYEKDGKVICKRCDVAINPATIGFKGGCNPIPIDFAVDGGSLVIPVPVLDESAKVFA